MIQEQFYIELGKFIYAVALSDGLIQPAEVKKLERTISDELMVHESFNMSLGNKDVILTKLSFHNCIREHISMKAASQSFFNFLQKNDSRINDHERTVAVKLIHRVSSAFKGVNVNELKLEEAVGAYMDSKK